MTRYFVGNGGGEYAIEVLRPHHLWCGRDTGGGLDFVLTTQPADKDDQWPHALEKQLERFGPKDPQVSHEIESSHRIFLPVLLSKRAGYPLGRMSVDNDSDRWHALRPL